MRVPAAPPHAQASGRAGRASPAGGATAIGSSLRLRRLSGSYHSEFFPPSVWRTSRQPAPKGGAKPRLAPTDCLAIWARSCDQLQLRRSRRLQRGSQESRRFASFSLAQFLNALINGVQKRRIMNNLCSKHEGRISAAGISGGGNPSQKRGSK